MLKYSLAFSLCTWHLSETRSDHTPLHPFLITNTHFVPISASYNCVFRSIYVSRKLISSHQIRLSSSAASPNLFLSPSLSITPQTSIPTDTVLLTQRKRALQIPKVTKRMCLTGLISFLQVGKLLWNCRSDPGIWEVSGRWAFSNLYERTACASFNTDSQETGHWCISNNVANNVWAGVTSSALWRSTAAHQKAQNLPRVSLQGTVQLLQQQVYNKK